MRAWFPRLLPAILLLAAGCLPNATWLPDSSGFVYTGGQHKDALYLYDLEKKKPHVLVEKGAGPAWPAVNADGKRIAVVLRTWRLALASEPSNPVNLEIVVFGRDGKELHHSPKLEWCRPNRLEAADNVTPQAFWVPGEEKLLVYSDNWTGVYDLKPKSVVKHERIVSTFGNSPILPNGRGFLARDREGMVVVDWEGRVKKIKWEPKDDLDSLFNGDGGSSQGNMILYPLIYASHWNGPTAVVSWGDVRVKINSDKAVGTLEHIKPALTDDKKVIQQQIRLSEGGVIRIVELKQRFNTDRESGDSLFGSYRVEVIKQGAKEPKILMDGGDFGMIYPSPDGKKAVVKCSKSLDAIFTESKPDQDMLFLIDAHGNVTDKIDLSK
jgi:hypothetical protein